MCFKCNDFIKNEPVPVAGNLFDYGQAKVGDRFDPRKRNFRMSKQVHGVSWIEQWEQHSTTLGLYDIFIEEMENRGINFDEDIKLILFDTFRCSSLIINSQVCSESSLRAYGILGLYRVNDKNAWKITVDIGHFLLAPEDFYFSVDGHVDENNPAGNRYRGVYFDFIVKLISEWQVSLKLDNKYELISKNHSKYYKWFLEAQMSTRCRKILKKRDNVKLLMH